MITTAIFLVAAAITAGDTGYAANIVLKDAEPAYLRILISTKSGRAGTDSRPGLRLYDSSGREVGYLIDSPQTTEDTPSAFTIVLSVDATAPPQPEARPTTRSGTDQGETSTSLSETATDQTDSPHPNIANDLRDYLTTPYFTTSLVILISFSLLFWAARIALNGHDNKD